MVSCGFHHGATHPCIHVAQHKVKLCLYNLKPKAALHKGQQDHNKMSQIDSYKSQEP